MSIRTHLTRKTALRSLAIAGIAAAGAVAPAAGAFASTHAAKSPDGLAPIIECLNWSGTEQYFPALGSTAKTVTVVLKGTGTNCQNGSGGSYTFGASFFGELTGTASKKSVKLSGQLAVTWPSDSGSSPTIAGVQITGPSSGVYQMFGTGTAGTGTGEHVNGSYAVGSSHSTRTTTTEHLFGTAPLGVFINE